MEIKIGDKVIMNEKYVVTSQNKGKVFTVRSHPFAICGTESVLLEGFNGPYATKGLTIVEEANPPDTYF